jgi:hypothetical protein
MLNRLSLQSAEVIVVVHVPRINVRLIVVVTRPACGLYLI